MIKIAMRMAPDYVQRSLHLVLTDDTIHFRHSASITSKNENAMHKEIKSQEWTAEEKRVLKYLGPVERRPERFVATEASRRLWRTYEFMRKEGRKGAEDSQQLKDSRIWKKHVSTFERENVSFMYI